MAELLDQDLYRISKLTMPSHVGMAAQQRESRKYRSESRAGRSAMLLSKT
jgi:hypothetical protein